MGGSDGQTRSWWRSAHHDIAAQRPIRGQRMPMYDRQDGSLAGSFSMFRGRATDDCNVEGGSSPAWWWSRARYVLSAISALWLQALTSVASTPTQGKKSRKRATLLTQCLTTGGCCNGSYGLQWYTVDNAWWELWYQGMKLLGYDGMKMRRSYAI